LLKELRTPESQEHLVSVDNNANMTELSTSNPKLDRFVSQVEAPPPGGRQFAACMGRV